MKNAQRSILCIATLAAALVASIMPAQAQESFPSRAIRLIVPQPTGTGGDIVARMMAEKLKQDFGQSVFVDNRIGANGVLAMAYLVKQPPDGHTVLLAGVSQMSFNHHLYKDATFDTAKDFTYVSPTVEVPFVLIASRKSGIRTISDLTELAKSKAGGVNF